ncbi:hypothetical protein CANCADRAFT_1322 [Tortispora caseinolytica NRRL Y-17796]|uniref:Major facilitator superfamily (MFS) profile domain-containing protein n=1 Tax=Tortispora caseinolytica NRRL Y-17796 TaxID=767744 RepID=A0A1E4TLT0_9ASCO|nr:hypothetical protein CANCADRAFT_1322 [Tortispora caseinolytica NRRL Y-17796]
MTADDNEVQQCQAGQNDSEKHLTIDPSLSALSTANQPALHRATSHVEPVDAMNFPLDIDIENPDVDVAEYVAETDLGYIKRPDGVKLVTFKTHDKGDPRQWSTTKKWLITLGVGFTCFIVALGSAIVTGDLEGPAETFNVSMEVSILQMCLFVVGFGVGPMVFAPMSELLGRRIIYASTFSVAAIFVIPCAVAPNIATLIVCRLIDGIAFSAPMTLVGGTLADMWSEKDRGVAMAVFSCAPFLGPVMGPLIGGFIGMKKGWRWIYWVFFIFSAVTAVLVTMIPETHAPTILKRRAKQLRKANNDDSYKTDKEIAPLSVKQLMKISFTRPFTLLFGELIVFLLTIYMSVIYGLIYMFFLAFPIVFQEGKGWNAGLTGCAFLGIAVGTIIAAFLSPFVNKDYNKRAKVYLDQGRYPPAELRLIPMMFGCWTLPIGLFIFAWTSYPHLPWIAPVLGAFPCGIGFTLLYNSANNYIVDSYQHYAASALAAKTFLRSFWGAGVTLFTIQMYHKLNPRWASSLLAFIALACCAIPFTFYIYGAKIRSYSKYAYSPEDTIAEAKSHPVN